MPPFVTNSDATDNSSQLRDAIAILERQYQEALVADQTFEVLKEIRDKIKLMSAGEGKQGNNTGTVPYSAGT